MDNDIIFIFITFVLIVASIFVPIMVYEFFFRKKFIVTRNYSKIEEHFSTKAKAIQYVENHWDDSWNFKIYKDEELVVDFSSRKPKPDPILAIVEDLERKIQNTLGIYNARPKLPLPIFSRDACKHIQNRLLAFHRIESRIVEGWLTLDQTKTDVNTIPWSWLEVPVILDGVETPEPIVIEAFINYAGLSDNFYVEIQQYVGRGLPKYLKKNKDE